MKKILTAILLVPVILTWTNNVSANENLTLKNGSWEIVITNNTIMVWEAIENTAIIDLFSKVELNGNPVQDYLTTLDVRYVSPTNEDHKISTDTEIIDKGSKVYVLFKTEEKNGIVKNNDKFSFTTKNIDLKEIWNVSNEASNSYNTIYKVSNEVQTDTALTTNNTNEQPIVEPEVQPEIIQNTVEEKTVDKEIIEENKTWEYSNLMLISLLFVSLFLLLWVKQIVRK